MTRGSVAFVTANTFEFDSRHRRAAEALARDGWTVVVVAMPAPHLPAEEALPSGVVVRRPAVERRILAAVPRPVRGIAGRFVGLDPDAEQLPPRGAGLPELVRAPLRRALEILAYRGRIQPWAHAVRAAAPDARVFVAKALVALPVAADVARRRGGRYVYDIADLHVESGRLATLPRPLKAYLRRREARWMRGAAALLAVTPAMADEVAARFGVDRPTVVMNARERWRASEPVPRPIRLRTSIGARIPAARDVVIYQGAFRPDQGIDVLLAALREPPLADRPLTTAFLGFGPLDALLRAESAAAPDGIVVGSAVPPGELLTWTAGADVAFVGTPPLTRNQTLTTPNKLFEAAMAGVPVVVAGGTFTARLVREHALGVVVEPWTAAAVGAAIASLLDASPEERDARRRAIRATALESLNWDIERKRLIDAFRNLG
jgi:glycosyltransferase involved in cell wall biosynthesis